MSRRLLATGYFAFGFDQLPAVRDDTMNAVALRNAVVGQFAWLALTRVVRGGRVRAGRMGSTTDATD